MHKDTPRRLRHAAGYTQLGLIKEATAELDLIEGADRLTTPVLAARMELEMEARNWNEVIRLGGELARTTPELERAWICWAYALRELQRVAEARDVLLEAASIHGKTCAVLHYNLACYYSLLG